MSFARHQHSNIAWATSHTRWGIVAMELDRNAVNSKNVRSIRMEKARMYQVGDV